MSLKSIEWSDLQKQYKSATLAYNNRRIDSKGTILVGKNGSGKSTLLKAIMGLIQIKGTIQVEGSTAYMPERALLPPNCPVEVFLKALGGVDIKKWLRAFGLYPKRHQSCSTLSKGMQGKVNLIQCIMTDSDWYLLDEPTSGLDKDTLHYLTDWLKKTKKQWILTTHQPKLFSNLNAELIYLD